MFKLFAFVTNELRWFCHRPLAGPMTVWWIPGHD